MTNPSSPPLQLLLSALRATARERPGHVALRGVDGEVTYADLAARLAPGSPGPAGRRVLPVSGAVADVVALLSLAARGHGVLVVDAAAPRREVDGVAARFTEGGRDAPVLALTTSGTTGLPKLVEADWPGALVNARAFGDGAGFGREDVIWCSTPLHHRYCLAAGVLGGLLAGATVLLAPGLLGPAEFTRRLVDERVTVLLSVPFLYGWYVQELARDPAAVRDWRVRRCVTAGAPLPADLAARWLEVTGQPLVPHYGTTEDGQLTLGRGRPDEGVGAPLPGVEVRVGAAGELLVRADGGSWRATGDVGHLDGHGDVHITGRATERLNVAGKKVDPVEVEQALRAHPGVADAVVAGLPGPTGDEVVAFVVAGPDVADLELRRHVGALLSAHKVPRRVVRVDEVPRTRTGKPRRGALVAELLDQPARSPKGVSGTVARS